MCLSQPETTLYPSLPWSLEKTVFHKTAPWCQKSWRPLASRIPVNTKSYLCKIAEYLCITDIQPPEYFRSFLDYL